MQKLKLDELVSKIESGLITEILADRVEFKSSWQQDNGKDISAIANCDDFLGGWLILGIDDKGSLLQKDEAWLKSTEEKTSNHLFQYLSPSWAVSKVVGKKLTRGCILLVEIVNPGEVVTWNERAYKLSGTISNEMTPDEQLALSMRLPGEDYSKQPWTGGVDGSLVLEFAKKIKTENNEGHDFFPDLETLSSTDILSKLRINKLMTAGILFGEYKVRVVHYDEHEDILDQQEKSGVFYILTDGFIDHVQSWTRKQGSLIQGQTVSSVEEKPYPIKALREVLANAVAHALYPRDHGHIIVELRPSSLTVRNYCTLEAKTFVNKWFSRDSNVKNKLLMNVLRIAKITDELGSGKNRVFRQMIEAGRREPVIDFTELGRYGYWSVTLYNEETNQNLLTLIERIKHSYKHPDYWRVATAFVLWKNSRWSEIKKRLDQHYARVGEEVLRSENSPVIVVNDQLFAKRWVIVALTGQMSRQFSSSEEEQIKHILKSFAFRHNRNGFFSSIEARNIIGLSETQSERVQLSNLFRKWKEKGVVKTATKRGQWQFLGESEKNTEVIMAFPQVKADMSKQ